MYLALDLDGTLLTTEKKLTERNLYAIERAQEAGTTLVLASGRHPYSMARFADALSLRERGGYVVAFNGGQIVDCATGQVLFRHELPRHALPLLCRWARHYDLPILSFRGNTIITEHPDNHFVVENAFNNRMKVEGVDDFLVALQGLDVLPAKCLLPGPPEMLPEVERVLKENLHGIIDVYRSAPHYLELVPLGIDKGNALRRLLLYNNIAREELIACGDQDNDIPMIRYAGIGVAMGNAAENVKASADYVTFSNDDDGVAHVIEHFII